MRWRSIGPHRGGRTKAITGVPGQPNVFYMAPVNGGVWKTNDFGRTWNPIFDDQPTGSIGSIAVAPSDANIIYVGSGEGLARPDLSVGDGIYKSTDAGKTWTHLGLRDGQQIPYILVDPRDANRLYVAVLGHPYGPNEERGIYRSTDGGRSFQKVLSKDENTGGNDLEFDPKNPDIVYATMWEQRQGPWENGAWAGTNGGIFKSTDGGTTWRQLSNGLPSEGIVQADIAVAPSDGNRIYATVANPTTVRIYRSDDAGENWTQATPDNRPAGRIGGGDLPVPVVNPKNRDAVIIASTVSYRSEDGGRTWVALRGAPGGDDYQRPWINPDNPNIIALASDQGAIISVNNGETWSSWYNQATSQMYHVNADNAFPYRVCGGQQESGSACVSSRGDDGMITFREWHPVGVEEYGYAVPDPLNENIVYGGKVTRYDRRIAQVQNIAPTPVRPADFRTLRTAPVVFSAADPHVMYFAANTLWKTADGGKSWQKISPDLTRKTFDPPPTIGKYRSQDSARATQRGVIYAVAPSPLDINRIWAGTDDGLIQVTADGGATWTDVTPPDLKPFAKVSVMDAGHFDANTAYAAINTLRLGDMHPHIYRTHDGGKTWTQIVNGLPDGAPVDAVREDPKKQGLLFAGTEHEVHVSFDDGDHWQSLRLNMPATSVRDVIVKGDDLVAGTHGRGIWILDDITPLRQIRSASLSGEREPDAILFKPEVAYRVRQNTNTDTPIPPDETAGQNPPDGAIINYSLASNASGPVTLEIYRGTGLGDGGGRDPSSFLVRKYSSDDRLEMPTPANAPVPMYWYRAPHPLATTAGMHRFTWDVHYQPIPGGGGGRGGLPIAAVPHDTVPVPASPWAAPGQYTVKLTVNGKSYTQPLTLKMDPRVKTSPLGLTQQFTLSKRMYDDLLNVQKTLVDVRALRDTLNQRRASLSGEPARSAESLALRLTTLEGGGGGGGRGGGGGGRGGAPEGPDTLGNISGGLNQLMGLLQGADVTPTTQLVAAVGARHAAVAKLMAQWTALKAEARRMNLN
ncbi:MAG: glycoside hydrolase [Acidobacteriia bacterium]|nr:glycoside hydrolase [Terriglobia bacterium]